MAPVPLPVPLPAPLSVALLPGLLVALPLTGAALVPLAAALTRRSTGWLALAFHAGTAAAALGLFLEVPASGPIRYALGGWPGPWGIEIYFDGLSTLFALLVAGTSLVAAWIPPGAAETGDGDERPAPVREGLRRGALLLLLSGLVGMVATRDLFNLFVFMEVSSLAAATLIASGGGRAPVAAFRYLLAGTVAGSLYLFGVGFLYAVTGTLNLDDLAARLPGADAAPAVAVGVALLAVGLFLKAALFPLHGWLPDAYVRAPVPASAFIAAVMAKVSAYAALRLFGVALGGAEGGAAALQAALWLGILGAVVGGVFALAQREVSRMLAWSSVGAMGTILLGIALGTPAAITGALFHAAAHALAKGCLFFGAGGIRSGSFGGGRGTDADDYRRGWAGLGARAPFTAAALSLAAFSMIGLPPTAGFFSKYLLLDAALDIGGAAGTAAFIALLVSSLLSAIYFLRVVESVWFRSAAAPTGVRALSRSPAQRPLAAAAVILGAAVLALGVFAGPFRERALADWDSRPAGEAARLSPGAAPGLPGLPDLPDLPDLR